MKGKKHAEQFILKLFLSCREGFVIFGKKIYRFKYNFLWDAFNLNVLKTFSSFFLNLQVFKTYFISILGFIISVITRSFSHTVGVLLFLQRASDQKCIVICESTMQRMSSYLFDYYFKYVLLKFDTDTWTCYSMTASICCISVCCFSWCSLWGFFQYLFSVSICT